MTMQKENTSGETTNAQQRGFDDFQLELTQNPYPEGTDDHVLWQNGWNIAFMLDKRSAKTHG